MIIIVVSSSRVVTVCKSTEVAGGQWLTCWRSRCWRLLMLASLFSDISSNFSASLRSESRTNKSTCIRARSVTSWQRSLSRFTIVSFAASIDYTHIDKSTQPSIPHGNIYTHTGTDYDSSAFYPSCVFVPIHHCQLHW